MQHEFEQNTGFGRQDDRDRESGQGHELPPRAPPGFWDAEQEPKQQPKSKQKKTAGLALDRHVSDHDDDDGDHGSMVRF